MKPAIPAGAGRGPPSVTAIRDGHANCVRLWDGGGALKQLWRVLGWLVVPRMWYTTTRYTRRPWTIPIASIASVAAVFTPMTQRRIPVWFEQPAGSHGAGSNGVS